MFGKRFSRALAVATTATLIMASAAFADDISNDLDASIDAALEVMNLTAGGSAGSTLLSVTPRNEDGKQGCNLTGSTTLVTSVNTSNAGVATVSPTSLTWTSCGDVKTLTVTPVGTGSATISLGLTSNGTDGTFNLDPASFTVNVAAAAPSDTTAPEISYVLNPAAPDGTNDWYKSNVTLTWTVTENESAASLVKTGCVDQNITADQASTTYSCSATSDGGSAGPVNVTIKRDATAPTVAYTSAAPGAGGSAPNAAGWYTSNVEATFTATDNLSGFGSGPSMTATGTSTTSGEGSSVTVGSPAFTDNAGNTRAANAATSAAFKIDLSDPTNVAFVGGPAAGSSHYFGSVPAAPTCTADDAISGIASCSVTGHSTAVGTHTMTATATDNAGRTASLQRSYTVLAWTTSGYHRPVDMGGTINTVKGGSTVPLKFNVYAASELTDVTAIKGFKATEINCEALAWAPADDIEITTTGGTSLRYDLTEGQFIQNWKTPTTKNKCYSAVVTFQDGSSINAYFKTK